MDNFEEFKKEVKEEVSEIYGLVRETATVHGANNVMLADLRDDFKEFKNSFKLLREVINGNGHPEEGMVYRLRQIEKTQDACPIIKVAADVAEIKTALKINEAKQPVFARAWAWAKQHPKSAVAWVGIVLTALGFSGDKLIKITQKIMELIGG